MKALVVARPGLLADGAPPAALSGQGMDAVEWLFAHRWQVSQFESTLTAADIGRQIDLPLPPEHLVGEVVADDAGPVAPWAHNELVLRSPSGTDPRSAIREAMAVFHERTDGTNALPSWWATRFWHGGPWGLKPGDMLLPPSYTGRMPGMPGTDTDHVYLTTGRGDALLYAARHNRPTLYEVRPTADPIPDDVVGDPNSVRVPSARVLRVEVPSRVELAQALRHLEEG